MEVSLPTVTAAFKDLAASVLQSPSAIAVSVLVLAAIFPLIPIFLLLLFLFSPCLAGGVIWWYFRGDKGTYQVLDESTQKAALGIRDQTADHESSSNAPSPELQVSEQDQHDWLESRKMCAHCGTRSQKLTRCSACKMVYYCSKEHQKVDWNALHKQKCRKLRACLEDEIFSDGKEFAAVLQDWNIFMSNAEPLTPEDLDRPLDGWESYFSLRDREVGSFNAGFYSPHVRALTWLTQWAMTVVSACRNMLLTSALKPKRTLRIHVVDPIQDRECMFAHLSFAEVANFLPEYSNVEISFIGPGVSTLTSMPLQEFRSPSKKAHSPLSLKLYSLPYHEFIAQSNSIRPDLIVMFNISMLDLSADGWRKLLSTFHKVKAPVLLTLQDEVDAFSTEQVLLSSPDSNSALPQLPCPAFKSVLKVGKNAFRCLQEVSAFAGTIDTVQETVSSNSYFLVVQA